MTQAEGAGVIAAQKGNPRAGRMETTGHGAELGVGVFDLRREKRVNLSSRNVDELAGFSRRDSPRGGRA